MINNTVITFHRCQRIHSMIHSVQDLHRNKNIKQTWNTEIALNVFTVWFMCCQCYLVSLLRAHILGMLMGSKKLQQSKKLKFRTLKCHAILCH